MKIGIIGTGIIAQAVVQGFCKKGVGHKFNLSPRNADRAAKLAETFEEVFVCKSNQEVIDKSDCIFICLHKKDFGALSELNYPKELIVINMSAEMRLSDLKEIAGEVALVAHVIPLPFIAEGYGPLLVYPRISQVGELFAPVSEVCYADTQEDVYTLQIITGLMSAYNMLLHEVVTFSVERGLAHDDSVRFVASLFGSLGKRAAKMENCDLIELAHEMTPGGYNEQAMNELLGNGAISAWRDALDNMRLRLEGSR